MSDRDALIAAVLANPDEDAPRLIFADYLEENGDPLRAEFIRVPVELARRRKAERDLPDSFGDELYHYPTQPGGVPFTSRRHNSPEQVALLRRQAELLAHPDCREKWGEGLPIGSGPLPALAGPSVLVVERQHAPAGRGRVAPAVRRRAR